MRRNEKKLNNYKKKNQTNTEDLFQKTSSIDEFKNASH